MFIPVVHAESPARGTHETIKFIYVVYDLQFHFHKRYINIYCFYTVVVVVTYDFKRAVIRMSNNQNVIYYT